MKNRNIRRKIVAMRKRYRGAYKRNKKTLEHLSHSRVELSKYYVEG